MVVKIKLLIFLVFTLSILFLSRNLVQAQEMSSENFKIQGGNFNVTSGTKTSSNFRLSDVVGQSVANLFTSKGYVVRSGFLNSLMGSAFTFSVSPTRINFGNLTAHVPVEKNIHLTISNGKTAGYVIKTLENTPLSTFAGAQLPDTVCDTKNTICTQKKAAAWTNNSSYGFGYRLTGKTVPSDFKKANYYRPFPAENRHEEPVIIMESNKGKVEDSTTMTLKVNISSHQPVGIYNNTINFTAIPGI